jgi:hypothetical protein
VAEFGVGKAAAALMARSAKRTIGAPNSVAGKAIEAVTGQIEDYNKALSDTAKAELKVKTARLSLLKVDREVEELEAAHSLALKDKPELLAKTTLALEKARLKQQALNKETRKANDNYTTMHSKLQALSKPRGAASMAINSFTILAGKVAGATTAFFSFRKALEAVDRRVKISAKQVGDMGLAGGSLFEVAGKIKDRTLEWDGVINKTNMSMAKMGFSVGDTAALMSKMSGELRLTTAKQGDLASMTGEITQDIGHMSTLLRVNTDELADATITASKKFGKGTKAMANDLAGMWSGMEELKIASKDSVVSFGDLTRATLEMQAGFTGYNFNMRETSKLMGSISVKAQEQGATYEQSMKAAKGLSEIIAGGTAPDWAKYIAGDNLLGEVKKLSKAAAGSMDEFKAALPEKFNDLTDAQLKGLKNLAQNYKEYSPFSAANMSEELLRGTTAGKEEMFKLLKKYGAGDEGREVLKRVWGLDDAAATAATLAMQTATTIEDLTAIKDEAQASSDAAKDKNALPTIDDVRKQTQDYVNAVNNAEKGVSNILSNILGALSDSPWISTMTGLAGTAVSLGLQVLQLQKSQGLIQAFLAKGGGGVANTVANVGGKGAGFLKKGIGKALGVAGSLAGTVGLGGVSAGLSAAAGGATAAGTAAAATAAGGGTLAAVSSVAGPLLAAGAAGAALGYGLRKLTGSIEEATGGIIPSVDTLAQGILDFEASAVHKLSLGFIDLRAKFSDSSNAVGQFNKSLKDGTGWADRLKKVASGDLNSNTLDFQIAGATLEGRKQDELKGFAAAMAKSGGMTEDVALERLLAIQKGFDKDKLKNLRAPQGPAAATAENIAAQAGKPTAATVDTPQGPVTATLSPAQKKVITEKITTKLGPEVAGMGKSLFEKMGMQSDEFFNAFKATTVGFWQDVMPKMALDGWGTVFVSMDKKLKAMNGNMMVPMSGPNGSSGSGVGGMGGVEMSPDGSLLIKFMLPRDMLDRSNRQTAGYTE